MNPDNLTGALAIFETLDFIGLLTVAGAIIAMMFRIGRKVGSVDTTLHDFAEKNHADHLEIKRTLERGDDVDRDHEKRIGRLEGRNK